MGRGKRLKLDYVSRFLLFFQKAYARQENIGKDDLGKVYYGNRDDPPEDVSEALIDGCPSDWGASTQSFCPTWLKLLIFTKETLLICVERDGSFSGG